MGALVTGAVGFIGTNLVEKLLELDEKIVAFDKDIKSPRAEHIIPFENRTYYDTNIVKPNLRFIWDNVLKIMSYHYNFDDIDTVYHLAAASDIKRSLRDTEWDVENNINGTHAVLEMMRKKDIDKIVFTSTSALYGENPKVPTPEETMLCPISLYAATKVCAEMLVHAYAEVYGIKAWIFRFGNVVGKYQHRGVVYDFNEKLKENHKRLEILGDGKQTKSYFHVSDCISAMLEIPKYDKGKKVETYNIATYDWVDVTTLADIMCDTLKLNPKFTYTGGDRGWKGDIPKIQLSIKKALKTGWKPQYGCEESIRKAVRELNEVS